MMTVQLYYQEFGKGKDNPLVLLHGYPLDHTIWLPLVPYLEQQARIILPDLRGHGKSPAPDGVYSMADMAEDVRALMDALGIEKVVLGGHSMGGYVALAFARAFPERLSGFTLIASHPFADSDEKKQSRLEAAALLKQEGSAAILRGMAQQLSDIPQVRAQLQEIISQVNPAGAAAVLQGMAQREHALPVLEGLSVPTLIIAGAQDRFIPLDNARKMAQHLKQPWLEELPDCGHMPMMDQSRTTAGIIQELLQRCTQLSY